MNFGCLVVVVRVPGGWNVRRMEGRSAGALVLGRRSEDGGGGARGLSHFADVGRGFGAGGRVLGN